MTQAVLGEYTHHYKYMYCENSVLASVYSRILYIAAFCFKPDSASLTLVYSDHCIYQVFACFIVPYLYLDTLLIWNYCIRFNYRTYPYKRTVKKFRSLQITASVLFLHFFTKAYVVVTHLNCINFQLKTYRCNSDDYPQHMPL